MNSRISNRNFRVILSVLLLVLPQTTFSQSAWSSGNGRLTGLSITHDNDLIYEIGTGRENYDRNYTGAIAITTFGDYVRGVYADRPLRWLNHLTNIRPLRDSTKTHFYSLSLIGSAFTPDSLNTPNPLPQDRPYASLLGLAVRRLSVDSRNHQSAWTSELVVGMLGLDAAKRIQTRIHKKLQDPPEKPEPYLPEGWHNQISQGGELTAMYRVGWERFLFGDLPTPGSDKHVQAAGGLSGSVGYYTNVAASFGIRLGRFRSEFWEFSPSALSNANQSHGAGGHRGRRVEAFLHTSLRPRLNIYNALLQGQFKHSAVTVRASDVARAQLEYEVGGVLFVPISSWGMQLSWTPVIGRTRDAAIVPNSYHQWGSASLGFSFNIP